MSSTMKIAEPAKMKPRHYRIVLSFFLAVVLPMIVVTVYLWGAAKDQYISSMSFSIRTQNLQSATDLLGGLSSITGSSSSDVDILTQFIESGDIIHSVGANIDLESVFSQEWPTDFVFAYDPSGQFEDLHNYWKSSVLTQTVNGVVTLSVRTYEPQMSYDIVLAVFEASRELINRLSDEAHSDATRFSRNELQAAETRLTGAREAMTNYRLEAQIIDPNAALQAQMGILTALQSQLAEAFIQKDLLTRTRREDDPRMNELDRKIAAYTARIEVEQRKFGRGGKGPGGEDYATLFARYEMLISDLEFAELAYRSSQLAYDSAIAEAKQQARYLVAHVKPTLAEKSLAPNRIVKLLVVTVLVLLIWSIGLLIFYSIRDRR